MALLPWKKWIGIDSIVDISQEDDDERRRPFASASFSADGTPRVVDEEALAAARAANEGYAVPVHVLASRAHPKRQPVVVISSYLKPSERLIEARTGKRKPRKGSMTSALPAVAAVGLAGFAGRKLLKKLRANREEPLWALRGLEQKNLESYGDSNLLRLLPEEVLLSVTSRLGIADRLRLASTCRKLYHISTLPSAWASVDLSGSGPAVARISDKELWRLVRRCCGGDDVSRGGADVGRERDDVGREPPPLKGRIWRDEVLREETVVAPPGNATGGAAQAGAGPPGGIILASVNQLRTQQGQEQAPTVSAAPPTGAVVDSTWGYAGGVEENKSPLGRGDPLSMSIPLRYLDISGCSQISRECLTSIIAHSASSLRQVRASGACFLDRRGVDLIVQYGIQAEVDVELTAPNKVEWRMLLMNLRGERDQGLIIKRLLLKDAPLARIDSRAGKVLFQMSILHNMRLTELHLDHCVLRPSDAVTVLEAVQHNVGLHTLRISKAPEGIFEHVQPVRAALTAMLQDNFTLRSLIIEDTRVDEDCVDGIVLGASANGALTSLGLSRIKVAAFEKVYASLGPGNELGSLKELRLTGSKLPCRTLLQHTPLFQNSSRGIRHLELDVNTSCNGQCVAALSKLLDRNGKLHHLRLTVHYEEMTRGSAAALMRLMKRHGQRVAVQTPAAQGYKPVGIRDLQLATLDRVYKDSRPRLLFALFALACAKLTFAAA
ncbi:hypothetical protein KFL_001100270 [Klebsormidium nitens]|uniref:F-box domain-containing protein n=1 Tax=Klebsormidium nitens TaxID=105231 RepID=A0A1Y1HW65_KLENI|nr:hypothetical protein KFL_001100270 [Klebsormidium nitens]|eukprot:GAQ82413.1 hypothetical protein KFL_001100270 [Klebsormidium nitens]